jgi:hypothetical protein
MVPVPEIYGWRIDGREVFLYMQLIRGATLKQRWDYLSIAERTSVCGQFCGIISTPRQIKQHPLDRKGSLVRSCPVVIQNAFVAFLTLIVGSVGRQTPQGRIFESMLADRPFPNVRTFND